MRFSLPGWNHPWRHLDDLPRGQRQLLPATEPTHAQPGGREDCWQTSKCSGEILSAHWIPRPPPPTHSHKGADSNQVEMKQMWTIELSPLVFLLNLNISSLLLKSKKNLECCVLAVQSLISILKSDNIFKDVFREVGEFYSSHYHFIFDHKEFLPRIRFATSAPLTK